MHILFVFDRAIVSSQGGIERVTSLLANRLKREGHDVAYLAVSAQDSSDSYLEDGIEQFCFPVYSVGFNTRLKTLIEEKSIDTVILQGANRSVVAVLDSLPEGVRKILVLHIRPHVFHGNERMIMTLTPWRDLNVKKRVTKLVSLFAPAIMKRLYLKKYGRLYRGIAEKVDKFVLLSNHSVKRILDLTPGIDASKLASINNPNTFEISREVELSQKEDLVIFVGRLSNPQKNVTGFIDVWKGFHDNHPDWKAVVVGDGEHRDLIEKYARRKRVRNLVFAGHQKKIADFYKRAKIICMTSTYEGWGMILTEAMAYGCVPVAYDSYEAIHDIIDNGENGMLIQPFKENEMVSAMDGIAIDEALRQRMASAGRRKIKDFSLDNIAGEWEELLKTLRAPRHFPRQ